MWLTLHAGRIGYKKLDTLLQTLHQLPVDLSLHLNLTHEQEILELLHLGQQLTPNLEGEIYRLPAESCGLRFSSRPLHTQLQTPYCMMKPTEAYHLQRAGPELDVHICIFLKGRPDPKRTQG